MPPQNKQSLQTHSGRLPRNFTRSLTRKADAILAQAQVSKLHREHDIRVQDEWKATLIKENRHRNLSEVRPEYTKRVSLEDYKLYLRSKYPYIFNPEISISYNEYFYITNVCCRDPLPPDPAEVQLKERVRMYHAQYEQRDYRVPTPEITLADWNVDDGCDWQVYGVDSPQLGPQVPTPEHLEQVTECKVDDDCDWQLEDDDGQCDWQGADSD